jgi:hypothetical protein
MMIQAPVPSLQTTTLLPNPEFSDGETLSNTVDVKQSMNGTLYTYVKSNPRSKLLYTISMSRMKALELRAFIQAYYRAKVRVTNHKGEVWDVFFTSNPFEFSGEGRSSEPGNANVTITLEFEGILVTPVASPTC